jgi:hypothetical protein
MKLRLCVEPLILTSPPAAQEHPDRAMGAGQSANRREPAVSKNLDRAVRCSAIILLLLWRHRPRLWCDFG